MKTGQISQSMGVNTRPAHRIMIDGYWVLIDPNAPICLIYKLNQLKTKHLQKSLG